MARFFEQIGQFFVVREEEDARHRRQDI